MTTINSHFEKNPDWEQLEQANIGDMVNLKLIDTFPYTIRVVVSSVEGKDISGQVENIFDWNKGNVISGGDMVRDWLNKDIRFNVEVIHKVIKN